MPLMFFAFVQSLALALSRALRWAQFLEKRSPRLMDSKKP